MQPLRAISLVCGPFGTINEFEGKLYIQTGKVKGFEKPEDFYKSVKEAYEEAMEQEIEDNAPEQNVKAEGNKEVNAEIKDNAASDKEKIVVNEAFEDGAGKEISVKIEDDSKSVTSNKQM